MSRCSAAASRRVSTMLVLLALALIRSSQDNWAVISFSCSHNALINFKA
jgi:hypothetical protein